MALLGAALYVGLSAYADSLDWTKAGADEWVGHVGLDAIGVAVILHVAIGRRWPFRRRPARSARDAPRVRFAGVGPGKP